MRGKYCANEFHTLATDFKWIIIIIIMHYTYDMNKLLGGKKA